MTTDQAFEKAFRYFKFAQVIWTSQDKERYCIAENYHNEGIKIYNKYFQDEKNFSESASGSADIEDRKPSVDAVAEWDAFFENNVDPF
jgi:hypothetical protein